MMPKLWMYLYVYGYSVHFYCLLFICTHILIYIYIYITIFNFITNSPTCFGAFASPSGNFDIVFAKVIIHYNY